MPRVSIITATYNYSSVLRYAIQSALAQTFQDFEMFVIGDGCTDDSAEVISSFNDPRLRWHNLPENSGSQSAPNNKGIEMAQGEFIAYLGHDDLWYPNHLERLVKAMDEQAADWAHPLVVMIGPEGSGARWLIGLVEPGMDPRHANFITSGVMHQRSLVDRIGTWKDYRTISLAPDSDFHQRALRGSRRVARVENLSVFKFPSAWRKNVYREKPSHEQARYWQRMMSEPDFIEREQVEIIRSLSFGTLEKWLAESDVPRSTPRTAPRGAQVEAWRRYRGLEPKELKPRAWWEFLYLQGRRVVADVTRPLRYRRNRRA